MRPLPTTPANLADRRQERKVIGNGRTLELGPTAPATGTGNQRRNLCPTQQAYPWLLGASTLMAAVFCILYISKPVVISEPKLESGAGPSPALTASAVPSIESGLTPASTPKDEDRRTQAVEPKDLGSAEASPFEPTNLKIQHVLGVRGPNAEDLGRLTLEIPVLYQSGGLRWTQDDVEAARSLLTRINSYQTRSRELREEAVSLISEWDSLIISSIPDAALRADSPTLPENQGVGTAENAPLKSIEAIEIEK